MSGSAGNRGQAGRWYAAAAVLLASVAAAPAAAQDGFMFGAPIATLTLRVGPMLHAGGGDLLGEMREQLTLERGDFRAATVGGDLSLLLGRRVDVVLGLMRAETSSRSEFRDYIEYDAQGNELPIEQTTKLRTVPLTVSVRYLLLPRGERISELAWIPRATVPYVGAGGGVTWYSLRQEGDFVDTQVDPMPIFTALVKSSGSAPTAHALAGVDHWFTPNLGLNAEARYTHAGTKPTSGFQTYDRLDLSGWQATIGLSIRWR